MRAIDIIEKKHLKESVPQFKIGDVVKLSLKVIEGEKTRLQVFEGTVIARRGRGTAATFTVLKQTRGSQDTVEKTFPLHSPTIEKIKIIKSKKVRRAKLYYMRSEKK